MKCRKAGTDRRLSAEYYAQTGQQDNAEQVVKGLLSDTPNDPDILVETALIRGSLGKVDDAVTSLKDYLNHNKPDPKVVQALAEVFDRADRKDESVALYDKYCRENPKVEVWPRLYATELMLQNRNNDAEVVLRAAIDRFPKSADLVFAMANLMRTNDRAAEAIPVLRSFIDRNGATTDSLYALVSCLEAAGRQDEVLTTLQQILTLMPDHIGANNDLGYFWADAGVHLDEAERMIRKALYNQPDNSAFQDSLGWVYYKKGEFAKAVDELTLAVSTPQGQEAEGLSHLADALYRAGRKTESAGLLREGQRQT